MGMAMVGLVGQALIPGAEAAEVKPTGITGHYLVRFVTATGEA